MNDEAKTETLKRIEEMIDDSATNLWAGIQAGLKLFEKAVPNDSVQGMYILTDGMPNHMCPRRGYVATLSPMLKKMAPRLRCMPSIHTFGFGYAIRSPLLQSIAEIGDGNYAFIPDAGMIGTVFVHAVANLQSTYATAATLKLRASNNVTLRSTSGLLIDSSEPDLIIRLGNIQYGQSREIVVSHHGADPATTIRATLTYRLPIGMVKSVNCVVQVSAKTRLPSSVTNYHLHRNELCNFLSSLFPTGDDGEHLKPPMPSADSLNQVIALATSIEARLISKPTDADSLSLLHDLVGPDFDKSHPELCTGQIYQALSQSPENPYWSRWGAHYLPSLLHAHMRQTCNSFKDAGPLRYGTESPLFTRCREELDALFEQLPAPTPSRLSVRERATYRSPNMSRYHNSNGPCFLGSCPVQLNNSKQTTQVRDLRVGMKIWSPLRSKEVRILAIVETLSQGHGDVIHQIGQSLWITGYHPVLQSDTSTWVFPCKISTDARPLQLNECVYSILLEASNDVDEHAITVGGVTCVTLGHGLISKETAADGVRDVRCHPFLGDYEAVRESLKGLEVNEKGHLMCGGMIRDVSTGLASGFSAATL